MILETKNLTHLRLSIEEQKAFKKVDEILNEFQMRGVRNGTKYFQSEVTGECIGTSELARVRGLLDFFTETNQLFTEIPVDKQ